MAIKEIQISDLVSEFFEQAIARGKWVQFGTITHGNNPSTYYEAPTTTLDSEPSDWSPADYEIVDSLDEADEEDPATYFEISKNTLDSLLLDSDSDYSLHLSAIEPPCDRWGSGIEAVTAESEAYGTIRVHGVKSILVAGCVWTEEGEWTFTWNPVILDRLGTLESERNLDEDLDSDEDFFKSVEGLSEICSTGVMAEASQVRNQPWATVLTCQPKHFNKVLAKLPKLVANVASRYS